MNDLTDQQLLRDYAERQSETAFAEIVRRRIDLVYSAALRMVCDPHLAQDVTQGVFLALAQNSRQLTDRPVLSGWLHRTAQNIASKSVRTEVRRRAREQEAVAMNELLAHEPDAVWENIAPHLDTALGELSEPDRDALLLRYFERKSAREMAQTLNVSEEAAQKRVNRAVERLREFFSKRNVTVGASGLVALISTNAVQAAPVGLMVTISSAISLAGTAVQTSTAIAATKTIAMTTLQKTLITTAAIIIAGAGIYEVRHASNLENKVQSLQRHQMPLQHELERLRADLQTATTQLAMAQEQNQLLQKNISELPKLRGEVGRLKIDSRELAQLKAGDENDPTQTAMKSWVARARQLKQRLQELPEQNIPDLQFITEEDWLNATKGKLETEEDYRRALSRLRSAAEGKFSAMVQPALQKYMKANDGKFPTDMSQLQRYFKVPIDDAVLQRYAIFPAEEIPNVGLGTDWIISQKAPVDKDYDSRIVLGPHSSGSSSWKDDKTSSSIIDRLTSPLREYRKGNNGQDPSDPSELLPYVKTPQQKAALEKLIQVTAEAKAAAVAK